MRLTRRLQLHALTVLALVVVAILIFDNTTSWRALLLPATVAAVAGVILATVMARTLTRPMEELRDVARSLATGSLTSRPPLSSTGELGELATAIHRLAEQIWADGITGHRRLDG